MLSVDTRTNTKIIVYFDRYIADFVTNRELESSGNSLYLHRITVGIVLGISHKLGSAPFHLHKPEVSFTCLHLCSPAASHRYILQQLHSCLYQQYMPALIMAYLKRHSIFRYLRSYFHTSYRKRQSSEKSTPKTQQTMPSVRRGWQETSRTPRQTS